MNYNALGGKVEARLARARFPLRRLGQVAPVVQYGCSQRAESEPVGVPILRMNNLQADGWALDDLKYVDLTPPELTRWRLRPGDILFNRTNSKELVGKCEVFREKGDWVFASYLMRVVVNETQALPEFIAAFLNGPTGRAQIEQSSRQIIGMTNINAEEIRDLRIPLPDTATQRALLATLKTATAKRDARLADASRLLASLDAYLLDQLGLAPLPPYDPKRPFAIRLRDLRGGGKIFPDYYHPDRTRTLAALRATSAHAALQQVVSFIREQRDVQPSDFYVGLANVAPNTGDLIEAAEDVAGTVCLFQPGDVLFARLRPYLNKVWVADRTGVCSPEFHVMRLKPKANAVRSPEYLAAVLRASPTLAQTRHMMTGNTHPRLSNEDMVRLIIPLGTPAIQAAVTAEIGCRRADARRLHSEARRAWETARQDFETALLGPA